MRVLWLCNIMLPMIAGKLGLPASCNEGWLTGLMESLQQNKEENGVELGICFPVENIAGCSTEASAEPARVLCRRTQEAYPVCGNWGT